MEVALIIVSIAIAHGVFDFRPGLAPQMLGLTVLLVAVTTFVTPVLIKLAFQWDEKHSPIIEERAKRRRV